MEGSLTRTEGARSVDDADLALPPPDVPGELHTAQKKGAVRLSFSRDHQSAARSRGRAAEKREGITMPVTHMVCTNWVLPVLDSPQIYVTWLLSTPPPRSESSALQPVVIRMIGRCRCGSRRRSTPVWKLKFCHRPPSRAQKESHRRI